MAVDAWLTSVGDLSEQDLALAETSVELAPYYTLDVRQPLVAVLQNEIWDKSLDLTQIVSSANLLGSSWPAYTELAKSYLGFCRDVDPNDFEGSFDAYARFYSALQVAYGGPNGSVLNTTVVYATKQMLSYRGPYIKWVGGILLRMFNSIRSEKQVDGPSKRPILLFVAAMLCRTYFASDQAASCATVFGNIHAAKITLSHFPMAQQVEFRYWLGRFNLNNNNVVMAFKNLHWAYVRCLPGNNKRVILCYLVVPSILLGRLPTYQLLEQSGLQVVWPLCQSLRKGTFEAWLSVRDHPWFQQKRVDHALERHMPLAIYRRALVRFHHIAGNPKSLDFETIGVVLGLATGGPAFTSLQAEGVGLSLISAGFLKAIDLPANGLFRLRPEKAWPPLIEVFDILNPTLGGKDAWMDN